MTNLSDEIRKLQELHDTGALTDEEFARAKATVLCAEPSQLGQGDGVHRQLGQIRLQNEIARLDREWNLEREKYLISNKYGTRSVPNEWGNLLVGLLLGGFGVFFTVSAASTGTPAIFVIFSGIFTLIGAGAGISGFAKAGEYRKAHELYQERRTELLARNDGADG